MRSGTGVASIFGQEVGKSGWGQIFSGLQGRCWECSCFFSFFVLKNPLKMDFPAPCQEERVWTRLELVEARWVFPVFSSSRNFRREETWWEAKWSKDFLIMLLNFVSQRSFTKLCKAFSEVPPLLIVVQSRVWRGKFHCFVFTTELVYLVTLGSLGAHPRVSSEISREKWVFAWKTHMLFCCFALFLWRDGLSQSHELHLRWLWTKCMLSSIARCWWMRWKAGVSVWKWSKLSAQDQHIKTNRKRLAF